MDNNELRIEFLTSTTHGVWPRLCEQAQANGCDVLVINQYDKDHEQLDPQPGIRVFNVKDAGLARSRNDALRLAQGDICVFCDNDITLASDAAATLRDSFNQYVSADILTFRIRTPEGQPYKNYKSQHFRHNRLSVTSVTEVEVAFRLTSIKRARLRFDERFGLGAEFPTGEGSAFLVDAIKQGLHVEYVPKDLVVHPWLSSGKRFENAELMIAKGALFFRMYGPWGAALSRILAIKKYPFYRKHYGLLRAFELLREGERRFMNAQTDSIL